MFLSILSGQVKDYFVYNVKQNLIFAKIYNQMKTKFDIEANKTQYHTNWSLMTYSTLKTEKKKIGKTNLRSFRGFTRQGTVMSTDLRA